MKRWLNIDMFYFWDLTLKKVEYQTVFNALALNIKGNIILFIDKNVWRRREVVSRYSLVGRAFAL